MTLVCNGLSPQTLNGGGHSIYLFRLTISNTTGVVLTDAPGNNLEVGNSSGGGFIFSTAGNFVNVNNNTDVNL